MVGVGVLTLHCDAIAGTYKRETHIPEPYAAELFAVCTAHYNAFWEVREHFVTEKDL